MKLQHPLSWSCMLLSAFVTLSNAAVITSRPGYQPSTTVLSNTCRAITSPFDYSAKTRRDHELPVCSADSDLHARGSGDEVSPDVGTSLIGQTQFSSLFGRQVVGGDDYTCGPDRPCKNKACCPKKTGQCNYGEEACGTSGISPNDVCWSNCDAKAECGKNAKVPGQKCPLNVCCGKWGFCGMTKDFCEVEDHGATGGCQSNCDQPGPKGKADNQLNRVIGYYEAWRHDSVCQDMSLDNIPVNSLTHLYFSFAFITPGEYNIIGMDGLPDKLFTEFTNLKKKNPGLKTIIAVGGWTHNDPGPLQKVFSNMVSTKESRAKFIRNLMAFLRKNAFDGVDFDWEYPGADDRGGVPEDGVNFTQFLKELQDEISNQPVKYIVSFTAPTSFWYLRHFDLKAVDHVDFVNVMSYDLHGVWDRENPIGSHIYGHTNLTEMSLAFDLFWRNDVPASKLNMGLGFYGRAFQLADPSCSKPGCLFKGGATKGACSGESGILSYREIMGVIDQHKIKPVHDKEAGVKYITWNSDQWVSFDDLDTFKQKKELASKLGLGGYLVWAIDQDDSALSALSAVLDPKPLGDFRAENQDRDDWQNVGGETCYISGCGDPCNTGDVQIVEQKCGDGKKKSKLCCPLSGAPNPKDCHWDAVPPFCNGRCNDDEVMTHMSKYGNGPDCWDGNYAYCCKSNLKVKGICKWRGVGEKCHAGELPLTFSGTVIEILEDVAKVILRVLGRAYPLVSLTGEVLLKVLDELHLDTKKLYCCPEAEVKRFKNCAWYGKPGSCFDGHCPDMKFVQITDSYFGGGETCGGQLARVRTFCCESAGEALFDVPLKNLFEHPPTGDDVDTSFSLQTDKTTAPGDDDPNTAAFQFVLLASPKELQVSVDKRDGSHWEVFGCNDSTTEGEHTVSMVCTDFSEDSNCGDIGLGHGVPGTILQMPPGCGPGKYAVAKSMMPSKAEDHVLLLPRHLSHLAPRRPVVYDLTFDYNFKRVPTDMGDTQMRVDFSNQDDYWDTIVAGSVTKKKRDFAKRTLADVGGNPVKWLEAEARDDFHFGGLQKRDLHERWFGTSILEWLAQLIKPEIKREYAHKYHDSVTAKLFDESWDCENNGIKYDGHLLGQALLDIDIESSFGFTLIVEKLSIPLNLEKSYLTFYNKGKVTGVVTLEAVARMTYSKSSVILDLPFPGATFSIPGIATIGPQLVVEGAIDASLGMAGLIETKLEIAKWEVRQVIPNTNEYKPELINDSHTDVDETGDFSGLSKPEFFAGVQASGDVTFKLSTAAEFGVRFDKAWEIKPAGAAVVGEVSLTTKFATGVSTSGTCPFTYGLDVGARLFARAQAPDVFGWSGGEYNITTWTKSIIEGGTCPALGPIPTRRGLDLAQGHDSDKNHSVAAPAAYRDLSTPSLYNFADLSTRDMAGHMPLVKRGGVYGPAFSLGLTDKICPDQGGGEAISCKEAYAKMVNDAGAGGDQRLATRKRTSVRDAHLHAHQHHHARQDHHSHHHGSHAHVVESIEGHNETLLHLLLDRAANGKIIRACKQETDIEDDFASGGAASMRNAAVYGWVDPEDCSNFNFNSGTQARVAGISYHTEHILEAQMISLFFDRMNRDIKNLPNPQQGGTGTVDFCTYLDALWNIPAFVWTGHDTQGGAGKAWNPIMHIAAQFPGKDFKKDEFVVLEGPINTPSKTSPWRDGRPWAINTKIISTYASARIAFMNMRSTMGSRIYQQDSTVRSTLKTQVERIGQIIGALDTTLLQGRAPAGYNDWVSQNLERKWLTFMDEMHTKMVTRTESFVTDNLPIFKKVYVTQAEKDKWKILPSDAGTVLEEKKERLKFIKAIEDFETKWNSLAQWTSPL